MPLLRNVDFAADDGLDSLGFGGVIELHRAEEIAVIGHGDGGHFLLRDDVHQLVDFAGAVEQGIVGVVVQMNEWIFGHRQSERLSGETTTILTGSHNSARALESGTCTAALGGTWLT